MTNLTTAAISAASYIPFLHSVEFYVLMTVAAAAVVALCVRPSRREAAITRTVAAWIVDGDDADADAPQLLAECTRNGSVLLKRTGIVGVGETGHVVITITQMGFDLEIAESIRPGRCAGNARVFTAVFVLNFLGAERYHIHYVADPSTRFAAFSLHNIPGLKTSAALRE